ncbi:hypothetical protein [Flammeovirga sp. SubArs3]|uniref:hypothetical protein n=1 Tax=Flammeovirga sp. SubArs3 TaxID=2995316 RepID=UPI00248AC66C|nr:hypothetical protein [Flammeovirga sp. SubArs3]
MSKDLKVRITGKGCSYPARIRYNDDPIFKGIQDDGLFRGYKERRVLSLNESISEYMTAASFKAISDAGVPVDEIDLLIGYGSISEYSTPNILAKCHYELGLSSTCSIIPLNDEFNQLNTALHLVKSLIETGSVNTALICLGSNWTKHVDYKSSASISASDAAAALIVTKSEDTNCFYIEDYGVSVDSSDYSCMSNSPDVEGKMEEDPSQPILENTNTFSSPYFHLTEQGVNVFKQFGMNEPVKVSKEILERNNVSNTDVTLISHQASSVLMDFWGEEIQPNQYINTIANFANMTLVTVAFNFALHYDTIESDHLLLLCVGLEQKTSVILLKK